jgi:hypothetical protein
MFHLKKSLIYDRSIKIILLTLYYIVNNRGKEGKCSYNSIQEFSFLRV